MKAIIFIAHGSKKQASNEEFLQLIQTIAHKQHSYDYTQAAFLELAQPNIHTAVNKVIKKGATNITFYPYFLNSGKHVLTDIPHMLQTLQAEHCTVEFTLLKHFGQSSKIEEIILSDISQ
jgi:sirohydrochlorin cobaltochelatase